MTVKAKDAVTAMSLLAALGAVVAAFDGQMAFAGLLIMAAWVFDRLDGLVARVTRSANAFGAVFDDQVDHLAYTVAPGLILLVALRPTSVWLAAAASFLYVLLGTVRLSVSSVTPLRAPGFWLGMPRPAAGLTLVTFLNSHLFSLSLGPWVAAGLGVGMAAAGLSRLPYKSHKGPRNWFEASYALTGLLTSVALYPVGLMFDSGFLWMFVYLFAPFILLTGAERRAIIDTARRAAGTGTAG